MSLTISKSNRVRFANFIQQVAVKEGVEIPKSEAFTLSAQQMDLVESLCNKTKPVGSIEILPVTLDFIQGEEEVQPEVMMDLELAIMGSL